MDNTRIAESAGLFEKIVSGIVASSSLVLSITLWISLASTQPTLPLPAGYFLELSLGALISFLAFLYFFRWASLISWIFSGILLVFCVLSGFSVGPLYLPILLIIIFLSYFSDKKHNKPLLIHFGVFLTAGLVQLSIMLLVIQIYTMNINQ